MSPDFYNNDINEKQECKVARPSFLTFILILSLIGGAYNAFGNLFVFLSFDKLAELYNSPDLSSLIENLSNNEATTSYIELYMSALGNMVSTSRVYFLLTGLLYICSFYGAIRMWRLDKVGFHIYTIAQLIMLIVYSIFIDGSVIMEAMLTASFVLYYFLNYKTIMR